MTKFILDSGDPKKYRDISSLLRKHGKELWGSTTNPSLVAKKLSGKKLSSQEAFELQKQLIYEIVEIVPGPVSAEVYADLNTTADEMITQGKEIASWHKRVVVKLPTTLAGFKARTALRQENILTNNTLVFSQAQIFAISLHEHLIYETFGKREGEWPPFISPFVGRLDDLGENGLKLVENGMSLKKIFTEPLWMLEASVRSTHHLNMGIELDAELITAPASIYKAWLTGPDSGTGNFEQSLTNQTLWKPTDKLLAINSLDKFYDALLTNELDITHPLTEKGIIRFAQDWQAILS